MCYWQILYVLIKNDREVKIMHKYYLLIFYFSTILTQKMNGIMDLDYL